MVRAELRRVFVQPTGSRPGALMAQLGPGVVELTDLGTPSERDDAASRLRAALGLAEKSADAWPAALPEDWQVVTKARAALWLHRGRKEWRLETSLMKMNKQLAVALVAVAGAWCWPDAAQAAAQESGRFGGPRAAQWRERMQDAARDINLTDEQKAQLKAILQPQAEKFRDLRQDNRLTAQEKVEKFKAMREELAPQIKRVLTPEQFEKWERVRGQWLEKAPGCWQERKDKPAS